MIAIIDYGVGNLGSIRNMIRKIGDEEPVLASSADELASADKIILPGVGAFDTGMDMLNKSGMRPELDRQVIEFCKPVLGICLGMQMLGERSEEGKTEGLGYIPFICRRFKLENRGLMVPHMGWDYVSVEKNTPVTTEPREGLRFYFVHSYYAECTHKEDILFSCEYGDFFAAGVNRGNIYGVQFHPEKSHNFGKWLFSNFIKEL